LFLGLWNARNFNYTSIQNFYFPEPDQFITLTESLRFTTANTKGLQQKHHVKKYRAISHPSGYVITVQYLMTFNFVMMFLVLVLLLVDFFTAQPSGMGKESFLRQSTNSYDTGMKYGLLLFVIYVFGECESSLNW
jgi:hypothetical protein